MSYTKEEALLKIKEASEDTVIDISFRVKYKRVCDLCKKAVDRPFVITCKYCNEPLSWGLKHTKNNHRTKHICLECYKNLFPEDVY